MWPDNKFTNIKEAKDLIILRTQIKVEGKNCGGCPSNTTESQNDGSLEHGRSKILQQSGRVRSSTVFHKVHVFMEYYYSILESVSAVINLNEKMLSGIC